MADTITSSDEMKYVFAFDDGDNRTHSVPKPKLNVTAAQIHSLSQTLTTNQFILGDKTGAALIGIATADKISTTSTKLEI